jgi:hypothetical protein
MAQERKEKRLGRPPKTAMPGKRVSLGLKVTSVTKQRLDEEARKHGRTQSQQAELMIERAFAVEEQFGGPEMLAIVNLIAGAFLRGGQLGAQACQHPEWTPAEWMNDLFCYRAAVHSAIDALAAAQPPGLKWPDEIPPEERLQAERLHDFFAQIEQRNPGTIKVTHGGEDK